MTVRSDDMPVMKYKTFKEAEQALWNFNPDEGYFQDIHDLFEMAARLKPPKYPTGVFKYKTLAEAQQQRFEWELENACHKKKNKKLINP